MLKPVKGNSSPVNPNIFVGIYGNPGTRKTSWAITAESPILLDFDQRGHRAYNAGSIDRIDVSSFEDISEAVAKFKGKYKTIIIDTVGRALDNKSKDIIRMSKSTTGMKAHNPFGGLSLPGYGILKASFYDAVQDIRASGMDCVFVCHGKQSKEGESTYWEPDVVGSSSDEIYKVCDLLGLVSSINGRTAIRVEPSEYWQAKNPLGLKTIVLDKEGEPGWDVTLASVIEKCRIQVNKISDPVEINPIVEEIKACTTVELANDLIRRIGELDSQVDRDIASAAFKTMRTSNGFKYSKDRGVYA